MKVPLSWLKDFVDITLPIEELAHRLTMAGLEVEEIRYVGLPMPSPSQRQAFKITGIAWDPATIVVGAVLEVMPHPNADRLVLCRLDDGTQIHTVLTGAPNLYPYKGVGRLEKSIKVAYAKEGARIYDGHQAGQELVTLKRAKIRGVDSYSMACSEKELGISDEHEGIIFLDDDAPVGTPLADYIGDAVLDIAITPNIARVANIYGIAREISAITDTPLLTGAQQSIHSPLAETTMGSAIKGKISIEIQDPNLNPRFVLGLIEDVQIKPSPYQVQRRLRLAGMRPINNIVDATNYAMLELGEPLHAFDYDKLVQRAGTKSPTIITRAAKDGEKLVTLDGVERTLDEVTILVCDTAGLLSIAGVMGGAETEVTENTHNVLLEGASWNMIHIRRTVLTQNLPSEAAYRFSRGVHPAMSERGVRRGLELMGAWSGGVVASGLVDAYPNPQQDPIVQFTTHDVERYLGITLSATEIAEILHKLEFMVEVKNDTLLATTPDHRLDIGVGDTGIADLIEEIARIHGYERIPTTRISDTLPPQRINRELELEERLRDLLVSLGLQEVISYRMTTPEREARLASPDGAYVRLLNPIAADRTTLRRSLLSSVLEVVERNARLQPRQALFEIGPVYYPKDGDLLPIEQPHLVILLTGSRDQPGWQPTDTTPMDFFDLKGIVTNLIGGLHISRISVEPISAGSANGNQAFHPGKCARLVITKESSDQTNLNDTEKDSYSHEIELGIFGELHPIVRSRFELPEHPVLAGEFNLSALLAAIPDRYPIVPVPTFPPALEDLAIVVDEDLPARQVEELIRQAGDKLLSSIRLFDVYRGEQVGEGKKSLAYSITYQAADHTLTENEVNQVRSRIIRHLEQELHARLRT